VRHAARFLDPRRPTRDPLLDQAARAAATRLRAAPRNREAIEALRHRPGFRLAGFGDSLTADAMSWLEMLRRALPEVEAVNLGVSGDTTVHLVGRFAEVAACDPHLLVVLAGTNDARRHGAAAKRMLVPDRETVRNLALIEALAVEQTRARVVFVTPPPVLEDRIRRAPLLLGEAVSWRADDVARKAALVASLDAPVIDSRAVIRPPLGHLLLADGLHLSARGHERLASTILRSVARAGRADSRR
jgi:lysophospholipase L1-like esterase